MALTGLKETLTIAANIGVDITLADYEARELVIHLTAADALAVAMDELLEWLEDDEYTPESKAKSLRAALRQYEEANK